MDWTLRTWEPKWTFTSLGYFCQICGHGDERTVNTEVPAHRGMVLKWTGSTGSRALCPDPAMASMLLLWFEVKSLVIMVYSVHAFMCMGSWVWFSAGGDGEKEWSSLVHTPQWCAPTAALNRAEWTQTSPFVSPKTKLNKLSPFASCLAWVFGQVTNTCVLQCWFNMPLCNNCLITIWWE